MAQHQGPLLIAEVRGLGSVGIGDLGGLLDVGDKIFP